MNALTEHPRFPYGMAQDVRRAIADEVEITLAGFRLQRRPADVTAYAEQLEEFIAPDIHKGFRAARAAAWKYAPTPSEVRACVMAVFRSRTGAPARTGEEEFVPGQFPEELRRFYQEHLDVPAVDTAEAR